jgi:hypothetical protein
VPGVSRLTLGKQGATAKPRGNVDDSAAMGLTARQWFDAADPVPGRFTRLDQPSKAYSWRGDSDKNFSNAIAIPASLMRASICDQQVRLSRRPTAVNLAHGLVGVADTAGAKAV